MSKIYRRPMFRGGGTVSSYGNGIATGLADGGMASKRGLVDGPGGYAGESLTTFDIDSGQLTGGQIKEMAEKKIFGTDFVEDIFGGVMESGDFISDYAAGPIKTGSQGIFDYFTGSNTRENEPFFGDARRYEKAYNEKVMPTATQMSNELIPQSSEEDSYDEDYTGVDIIGQVRDRDTGEIDYDKASKIITETTGEIVKFDGNEDIDEIVLEYQEKINKNRDKKIKMDYASIEDPRESRRSSQYDDGSLKALLTKQRLAEEEANRIRPGGQDAAESDFVIPVGVVEEEPEQVVEEMGFKEMADAYYEMMGGGAEERMDARIAATEGREDDRIRRARGSDISNTLLKFFEGSQEGGATVGSSAANASRFLTSKPSETELAKRSKETKMDKLDDASFNRDEARRNKATDMAYKEYMQDKSMKFSDVKDQKSFDRKMEMLKMQLDNATGIAERQIIANRIRDLEKFDFAKNQKEGTKGALQKDIETLRGLVGTDRALALVKLGNPPDLTSALKELQQFGTTSPSTIKAYVGLYYGSEYKGIIGGDESPTLPGVYLDESMKKLMTVDANGKKSIEVLPTN